MAQDLQPYPLGPLGGLDARIVDDRLIQGTRLRGGQNVVVLDGEWWSRGGMTLVDGLPRTFGQGGTALNWTHAIYYEGTKFVDPTLRPKWYFVCKYGVIQYTASTGYYVPWHHSSTFHTSVTVDVVAGSPNITCATSIGGKWLWDGTGAVYMVSVGTGTQYTLDRAWEGATNATASLLSVNTLSIASSSLEVSDVTIFRQINNLAANDLFTSSVAIPAPSTWIVMCLYGATVTDDPIAVRIDKDSYQDNVTDFFVDTSESSPGAPTVRPKYVRAADERLVFGACSDPDDHNHQITWWYSAPGDMGTWHTGVRTLGGTPNFVSFTDTADPITGLEVSADRLTIHRSESQEVVTFQPTGPFDFDLTQNIQGFGVQTNDHRAIVVANDVEYLLTQGGPAMWDGQQMRYLDPALCEMFIALRDTTLTTPGYTGHVGWHDPVQGRLGWFIKTTKQLPDVDSYSVPWIVFDYRRELWSLLTLPVDAGVYVCGTSAQHVMFTNGTVATLPSPIYSGPIEDEHPDGVSAVRIDQRGETPWMDFGSPTQKHLAFLDLVLRAPHLSGEQAMTGADDSMTIRVEVCADYDEDSVTTMDLAISQSDFPSYGGFRAPPRVIRKVPIKKQGSVFRFAFTNNIGDDRNPFRLSNAIAWFRPTESRVKENT